MGGCYPRQAVPLPTVAARRTQRAAVPALDLVAREQAGAAEAGAVGVVGAEEDLVARGDKRVVEVGVREVAVADDERVPRAEGRAAEGGVGEVGDGNVDVVGRPQLRRREVGALEVGVREVDRVAEERGAVELGVRQVGAAQVDVEVGLELEALEVAAGELSRANYMYSDAASQGGGWWQGCGAAYVGVVEVGHLLVERQRDAGALDGPCVAEPPALEVGEGAGRRRRARHGTPSTGTTNSHRGEECAV